MIDAVVFDVGEVIVDETREYGTWADWLGVPRHTFSAAFGSVIATGRDYRETFQLFRLGFERDRRAAAGQPETSGGEDLYTDVRPCLSTLAPQRLPFVSEHAMTQAVGNYLAPGGQAQSRAVDAPVDGR